MENDLKNINNTAVSRSSGFKPIISDENDFSSAGHAPNLKDILEKAKRGDKVSFAGMYDNYFNPVYRYVYLRVGNKAESDDLVQDVFIKTYGSIDDSISASKSSIIYLFSIARKAVIDWKRKRRSVVLSDENAENHLDRRISGEDRSEGSEEFKNLHKAMRELSDEEQDAVIFKFMQGLSNEEISGLLKKPESEIYHLLSKGICSLRDNLKKQYE